MASWRQDYLLALQARDRNEKSQKFFYDACVFYRMSPKWASLTGSQDTKLADRTAVIHAQGHPNDRPSAEPGFNQIKAPKVAPSTVPAQQISDAEALAETRRDLSEAQRSRGIIQSRLDDVSGGLQKIKLQSAVDRKRLDELTSEKANLALRLRDRDEELRGKAKLLEVFDQSRCK